MSEGNPGEGAARPAFDRRTSEADVRNAYRLMLGRWPESDATVQRHLGAAPDLRALRDRFLRAPEFIRIAYQAFVTPTIRRAFDFRPNAMDIEVPPEQLERLFAHVQRVWTALGASQPHYSVISDRRFASRDGQVNRAQFDQTGRAEVEALQQRLTGLGIDAASLPHCVEYGCGVGRVTLPLAGLFHEVTGFDISQPHLDLAAEALSDAAIDNVTLRRVEALRTLDLPEHDFFYSRIVLQHNPPPLIAHILRRALARLRPGGIAVFQLVTHIEGYAFEAERYLAGAQAIDDQELHAFRQDAVFKLLHEAGMVPLYAMRDHSVTGLDRVSMQFVARRVAPP